MTKTPWQIFDKEASGKVNNNPVNSIKINLTISEGFLVMFGVRFFGDPILPIEWKLATWIFLPSRFVLMYSCTKPKWLEKNTLSLWWETPNKESYSPGQDSWSFTPGNLNKLLYLGGLKILAVQEFFGFFLQKSPAQPPGGIFESHYPLAKGAWSCASSCSKWVWCTFL